MPRLVYFKPKCEALVCFRLDLVTSGHACILERNIVRKVQAQHIETSTVFQIACKEITKAGHLSFYSSNII